MSAHHTPAWVPDRSGATGAKDNGILATWLGLLSFTFFYGVFLAANVYLRGWSPDKFSVNFGGSLDLPATATLIMILAGFITILAVTFYRTGSWKKFQVMMILATIAFSAHAVTEMRLVVKTYSMGAAAWTVDLGAYFLQFVLAVTCVVFLAAIGIKFSERNEKALARLIPAAMSVFFYTIVMGILTLVITDMISIDQFTQWCGTKIAVIAK